jgi:hypothetical protein
MGDATHSVRHLPHFFFDISNPVPIKSQIATLPDPPTDSDSDIEEVQKPVRKKVVSAFLSCFTPC